MWKSLLPGELFFRVRPQLSIDLRSANNSWVTFMLLSLFVVLTGCRGDGGTESEPIAWGPPTPLEFDVLADYWVPPVPVENLLTHEGVALGKALFHDPILSQDQTLSCATCHNPADAFSNRGFKVSIGIRGQAGTRNAPALFNLTAGGLVFWDGRSPNLEDQALHPVPDAREMDLPWSEAVKRLSRKAFYREAFGKAFGNVAIDSALTARALAQYVRSLISMGSRFDQWKQGKAELTEEELLGYELFRTDRTNCAHCHQEPLFTLFSFHNIGLDSIIEGTGMGAITGIASTLGIWKTPSLRNLAFTAPYMHDGRFATLDEVLDHYVSGGHLTATLDPMIRHPATADDRANEAKSLTLTESERKALLAFFNTLNDSDFVARHSEVR
jgi:cytochrome c peroxidase